MSLPEFRCERKDLFELMINDSEWFRQFIHHQFQHIVYNMEPVYPALSDYWIAQAHYRWVRDLNYSSNKEFSGGEFDHFKNAGFLCYWLRRCPPIFEFLHNEDTRFAVLARSATRIPIPLAIVRDLSAF